MPWYTFLLFSLLLSSVAVHNLFVLKSFILLLTVQVSLKCCTIWQIDGWVVKKLTVIVGWCGGQAVKNSPNSSEHSPCWSSNCAKCIWGYIFRYCCAHSFRLIQYSNILSTNKILFSTLYSTFSGNLRHLFCKFWLASNSILLFSL